mmetsp:Transcript_52572/g.118410  ORF Transcript_52572/g.118410 Transcript_52572/m.118410 type:complete len:352 (+) Transcript_52572:75-1130(+)
MPAVLKVIALAVLAPALARRLVADEKAEAVLSSEAEQSAEAEAEWEAKESRFCIKDEVKLTCDDDSIIVVRTGAYNRALQDRVTGQACTPFAGGSEASCKVMNKNMLKAKCNGKRSCIIKPEDHRSCQSDPFTFMRVRYECEAGPSREETVEVADAPVETPETLTEEAAPPQIVAVEEHVPEPPSKPVVLKAKPAKLTDDALQTVEKTADLEMMDDQKPVVVMGVKGDRAKKNIDVAQPKQHVTIEMKPCFRTDRFTLMYRMKFLDRLTNCGDYEGCFKLKFPDGKVYKKEKSVPTTDQLLAGELVKGGDSILVTFNGIKLQRNSYWTWGVCLPKTQGLQFAMDTFESLKA